VVPELELPCETAAGEAALAERGRGRRCDAALLQFCLCLRTLVAELCGRDDLKRLAGVAEDQIRATVQRGHVDHGLVDVDQRGTLGKRAEVIAGEADLATQGPADHEEVAPARVPADFGEVVRGEQEASGVVGDRVVFTTSVWRAHKGARRFRVTHCGVLSGRRVVVLG
jgi:hypothetical protein